MKDPIQWLVSRECHVSLTDLQVIRLFYKRMTLFNKADRREVYIRALQAHHEHQQLYERFISKKAVVVATAQDQTPVVKKGARS